MSIEINYMPTDGVASKIFQRIDPSILRVIATYLESMEKEKAHGSLIVQLNMIDGRVRAANFERRTFFQKKG